MKVNGRTDDLIASQVLNIFENGAGKIKIIYQANLNYTTAKHYLENLMKNGLVSEVSLGPRVIYKTTLKGSELKDKPMRLQKEPDILHKILCDIAK